MTRGILASGSRKGGGQGRPTTPRRGARDSYLAEACGADAELLDGAWHHVAGTYADSVTTVHVDGEERASTTEFTDITNPVSVYGTEASPCLRPMSRR